MPIVIEFLFQLLYHLNVKNKLVIFLIILLIGSAAFIIYRESKMRSYVREINLLHNFLTKLENDYLKLKTEYSEGVLLVTDKKGKEWKKYISERGPSFTLLYPLNWKVESGVFVDEKNNKVAEFTPGITFLNNRSCFEEPIYKGNPNFEIISQEPVTVGQYQGELQIMKTMYEGGSPNWNGIWYPNKYCLKTNGKAFYMTFYEYSEKPTQQKLYEQILITLKIDE